MLEFAAAGQEREGGGTGVYHAGIYEERDDEVSTENIEDDSILSLEARCMFYG